MNHGIKITEDNGLYQIETVEPWVSTPYIENEIGQSLYAGTFLMKMANIDYEILSYYNDEFVFHIQDIYSIPQPEMEVVPEDNHSQREIKNMYHALDKPARPLQDFSGLQDQIEKIKELRSDKLDSDDVSAITKTIEEQLEDAFDNYKSSLRANLDTFEYHLSEFEQEMFAELIACEIRQKMNSDTFDVQNIRSFMPMALTDSSLIKSNCVSILNFKNTQMSPQITELFQHNFLKMEIDKSTMKPFYTVNTLDELFVFDAYQYINSSISVRHCHNCGKYFFKRQRSTEVYCDYIYKDSMTCKGFSKTEGFKKDEFTKTLFNARKNQHAYWNKVATDRLVKKDNDFFTCYGDWSKELSQVAEVYRNNNDLQSFKKWIKETSFRKIGFKYPLDSNK